MEPNAQIHAMFTSKFDGTSLRYPHARAGEGYTVREYQRQWGTKNRTLPEYLNAFQLAYYCFEQLASILARDAAICYAVHLHVVWPGSKPLTELELLADGLLQVTEQYAVMFTSASGECGADATVSLQATALVGQREAYVPQAGDPLVLWMPYGEAQLGALLLERGSARTPLDFDEGERQRYISAFLQPPPALLIARLLQQNAISFMACPLPDAFVSLEPFAIESVLTGFTAQWRVEKLVTDHIVRATCALGFEVDALQYGDDTQLLWLLSQHSYMDACRLISQRFELSPQEAGHLVRNYDASSAEEPS